LARDDSRELGVAWAAIVLVGVAWLLTRPPEPEPTAPCLNPAEASARDGRTISVRCGTAGSLSALPVRGPARLLFGQPLDLNEAAAESLSVLPGIGPVRAAAIVAARKRHRFESLDDLRRVHGIGPRTVAGLVGWVTVTTSSNETSRAAPAPDG
jgi:competence ComEA-like helix-hairpin-helix protein